VLSLLTGGKRLRGNSRNNTGRGLTPYAFLEPGYYGSIGMLVSLRGRLQTCR